MFFGLFSVLNINYKEKGMVEKLKYNILPRFKRTYFPVGDSKKVKHKI